MPIDLAEWGIGIFSIGVLAYVVWGLVQTYTRRLTPMQPPTALNGLGEILRHNNEVVSHNNEVISRLILLLEQQGQMFDRIYNRLDELWREVVRKGG